MNIILMKLYTIKTDSKFIEYIDSFDNFSQYLQGFVNGYCEAEGKYHEQIRVESDYFKSYITDYYKISRAIGWNSKIKLFSEYNRDAFKLFYEHIDSMIGVSLESHIKKLNPNIFKYVTIFPKNGMIVDAYPILNLLYKFKETHYLYLAEKSLNELYWFFIGYVMGRLDANMDNPKSIKMEYCVGDFDNFVKNAYKEYPSNWKKIIEFSTFNDEQAYNSFYEKLDDYLNNKGIAENLESFIKQN